MNKVKYYIIAALLAAAGGIYLLSNNWGGTPIEQNQIKICSFNIMWLGHYKKYGRENEALANILKPFDIIVVQELVAPPEDGTYPDGNTYSADPEAVSFFEAMKESGFAYKLSEEDTGTSDNIHLATPSTEWWVAFYDPNSVECINDIPSGFIADDRSNHPDYERVPYAFAFRTLDGKLDFVLISVHLEPNGGSSHKARRKHELSAIADWIDDSNDKEKDFIILGDMNIEDENELINATPPGYLSLNDECRITNTNINNPKPYDHVMYNTTFTTEVDTEFDLKVINLVELMEPLWLATDVNYPGNPYNHNLFKQYYSDHNPVVFVMKVPDMDDD